LKLSSATSNYDNTRLEEARDLVINAMAETMDFYGISPLDGRLYGTMYFSGRPMSLNEMAAKLGMSKTSMSTSARALLKTKMLKKIWQKGVRNDLYSAEQDFFTIFINAFCQCFKREIEINLDAIEKAEPIFKELIAQAGTDIGKLAEEDLKKLTRAKKYYFWLDQLIKSVENGEIFKYINEPNEHNNSTYASVPDSQVALD